MFVTVELMFVAGELMLVTVLWVGRYLWPLRRRACSDDGVPSISPRGRYREDPLLRTGEANLVSTGAKRTLDRPLTASRQ